MTRRSMHEGYPERQFHLGLDFGTCWSKMILRDYDAPSERAYVVSPHTTTVQGLRGLIPSLVARSGTDLCFGQAALDLQGEPGVEVYDSIKMRAFFPNLWPTSSLPDGLDCDDLSTLVVCYLLSVALEQARCLGERNRYRPRVTVTMGAPVAVTGSDTLLPRAVQMVRLAHEALALGPAQALEKISINAAKELLDEAKTRLARKGPSSNPSDWVRAESEAGLLWFFRSPAVRPGLYGAVDIGAGTTDTSFFRIWEEHRVEGWKPAGIMFCGDATGPAGMDLITRPLLIDGERVHQLRGREQDRFLASPIDVRERVTHECRRAWSIYRQGFIHGYRSEPKASWWKGCRLFLMGGGSQFEPLCRVLSYPAMPNFEFPTADPGQPEDVYDFDGQRVDGQVRLLLVAYGLSFLGIEVPPAEQGQFEGARDGLLPPRRRVDQDELYPK